MFEILRPRTTQFAKAQWVPDGIPRGSSDAGERQERQGETRDSMDFPMAFANCLGSIIGGRGEHGVWGKKGKELQRSAAGNDGEGNQKFHGAALPRRKSESPTSNVALTGRRESWQNLGHSRSRGCGKVGELAQAEKSGPGFTTIQNKNRKEYITDVQGKSKMNMCRRGANGKERSYLGGVAGDVSFPWSASHWVKPETLSLFRVGVGPDVEGERFTRHRVCGGRIQAPNLKNKARIDRTWRRFEWAIPDGWTAGLEIGRSHARWLLALCEGRTKNTAPGKERLIDGFMEGRPRRGHVLRLDSAGSDTILFWQRARGSELPGLMAFVPESMPQLLSGDYISAPGLNDLEAIRMLLRQPALSGDGPY
ncbi:hypothetical protein DFH09DRAFT_1287544 [Mycena vulgaris]|nr:hypothetical protein DFH09DRAFT_1287544 [Mycena vulgaris]